MGIDVNGTHFSIISERISNRCRQSVQLQPFAFAVKLSLAFKLLSLSGAGDTVHAQELESPDSMESQALGLLHERCFSCHNEEDRKGGLILTSKAAIESANQEFDLLLPGQPQSSQLIAVLAHDADPHMPPKEQLTEPEIKLLSEWVQAGANWENTTPDTDTVVPEPPSRDRLSPTPQSMIPVLSMALSPKDDKLAFGQGNRLLISTNPKVKDEPLTRLTGHRDLVRSLAWNPLIKNRLASGGYRRIVYWDTSVEEPLVIQEDNLRGQVTALGFSPDGSLLYAGVSRPGISASIHCWTVPKFQNHHTWKAHDDTIFALEISPDGSFLATASGDRSIAFWETDTHVERSRIEAHSTQIMAISFSLDCRRLVTAGTDHQLRVWDWAKGDPLFQLGRHKQSLFAAQWSRDGGAIIAADETGAIFRYTQIENHSGAANARAAKETRVKNVLSPVQSIVTDRSGETIYAGTQSGTVHVMSQKGEILNKITADRGTQ